MTGRKQLYFTLFHVSSQDIRGLTVAALMTSKQLPLLEQFQPLIYFFILTAWFFFFSPQQFPSPMGGIESGESPVVILSGVVKIHLVEQFISIHILLTRPFIYLSGTIKINWFVQQSAVTVSYDFYWTGCWKQAWSVKQ